MISIKKNLRSQIDSQKSFYGSRKFTKAPLQQSLTNLIKSQDHRSLSKIDDTLELPPQHFKQIPAYKNYIQKIDYQQKQQGSAIFLSPSRQDKVKLELDKYYLNHEVINKNCNNIVQLNKSNTVYYLKTEKQTNPSPYDVNWTGVDSNIKGMTSFDGYSSRLPQVKKIKKPLSPINKYNQEANLDFQSLKNKTPIQVQPLNKNQMTQQILKTYNFYKLKTHATNALKMKER